jgi:transcriptional regulator with XRE-family HTH domain
MNTKQIGADLKQMREMCGLSQYELSMLADIPRNRISLAECGYASLRGEELLALHNALRKVSERRAAEFTSVFSGKEAVAV